MIDVGLGLSTNKNFLVAVEEAISMARNKKTKSDNIDLVLVFNTPNLPSQAISKKLNTYFSGIPIIGANVYSMFFAGGILKSGLIVLLISFSEGISINTAYTRDINIKSGISTGEEFGEKLLLSLKTAIRKFGLILFDCLIEDENNFITGLQERFGKSFPFIGGFIAQGQDALTNFLYFNQGLINNGCTGIIFAGKINFGLGVKHGWKPLGKPHTITFSHGNIIEEIDNKPAIELYKEYLNYSPNKLKQELKRFSSLYPLGIYVPEQKEYLLRNITDITPSGALVCKGNIANNSLIRLMICTKETCLEATTAAIEEAKQTLSADNSFKSLERNTSKLVIVFNSLVRSNSLKRDLKKEIEIIKQSFEPNTPIIGIYTFEELAPLKASTYLGQAYFQNQTINILIIEG